MSERGENDGKEPLISSQIGKAQGDLGSASTYIPPDSSAPNDPDVAEINSLFPPDVWAYILQFVGVEKVFSENQICTVNIETLAVALETFAQEHRNDTANLTREFLQTSEQVSQGRSILFTSPIYPGLRSITCCFGDRPEEPSMCDGELERCAFLCALCCVAPAVGSTLTGVASGLLCASTCGTFNSAACGIGCGTGAVVGSCVNFATAGTFINEACTFNYNAEQHQDAIERLQRLQDILQSRTERLGPSADTLTVVARPRREWENNPPNTGEIYICSPDRMGEDKKIEFCGNFNGAIFKGKLQSPEAGIDELEKFNKIVSKFNRIGDVPASDVVEVARFSNEEINWLLQRVKLERPTPAPPANRPEM